MLEDEVFSKPVTVESKGFDSLGVKFFYPVIMKVC